MRPAPGLAHGGLSPRASLETIGACLVLALLAPSCLPDAEPDPGRALAPGRPFAGLQLGRAEGGPWVLYNRPSPARADVAELWAVPFAGGEPRRLAEKRALAGPVVLQADGTVLFTHDPRQLPSASPDLPWNVFGLARAALSTGQVLEDIAGVQGFSASGRRFFFRRTQAGAVQTELLVRDGAQTVELGPSWGARFGVGETVFYVRADDNTLRRLRADSATPESLRADVGDFWLSPDGRWIVLQELGSEDKPGRRLVIGRDRPLPRPLPIEKRCRGLSFAPRTGRFPCAYRDGSGDRIDVIDLDTLTVDVFTFSAGPGFADLAWREDETVAVALAGTYRAPSFLVRPGGEPRVQDIGPLALVTFAAGGRFLVYVRPDVLPVPGGNAVVAGPLMLLDIDGGGPPRQLSPPGYLVGSFALLDGDEVAFSAASYTGGYADLFVVPLAGAPATMLASHVVSAVHEGRRVLALVTYASQDRTADLMLYDRASGRALPVAHAVADFAVLPPAEGAPQLGPGAPVTFIRRERVASEREGVWAATLP